jgi:hypothetical protein
MVFGNSFTDAGVGIEARSKGRSSILKSFLGKMIARCGNWKPTLSKSRISFFERLVPIFNGLDCTYFRFVPLMQRSMSSLQKKNSLNSGLFL